MPRFEMYLMLAEKDESSVETSEIKMICWVNDPNNFSEVQDRANEVIQGYLEDADKEVIFGAASVMMKGQEVLNIGFKNKDSDPEEVDEFIELFGLQEETAPKPIDELVHILGKFGRDTRFSDLTEEQVHTLIFGIQESQSLAKEIQHGTLEETYYKSTGTWPSTSIPF